jgi:hypothetical protein
VLAKCASPSCSAMFRSLEHGELFRVEPDPIGKSLEFITLEYFWLCRPCSLEMTLGFDEGAGLRIVPRRQAANRAVDTGQFVPVDRRKGLILTRVRFLGHRKRIDLDLVSEGRSGGWRTSPAA